MRLVTLDDFIDVYFKTVQRGASFIFSKFNFNARSRTKSAFDDSAINNSNWWIIPQVRQRWNEKITGNPEIEYEQYTIEKHFKNKKDLRMLSIGSGVCSHELKFAEFENFKEIICVDIADNLLKAAAKSAEERNLENITFLEKDINELKFDLGEFDIIMFHASLHHFSDIQNLISSKVKVWLKPEGTLLINEFVGKNRLQFKKQQRAQINRGLKLIPKRLRARFKSSLKKNRFYGSGYVRMIIADPSECIESENILPSIRTEFDIIEEKEYGGNLLTNILKDISHNFLDVTDKEASSTLQTLFDFEDEYLKENPSDFIYGLYRKPTN